MNENPRNQGVETSLEVSNSTVANTPATGAVVNNDEIATLKAEVERLKADNEKLEKSKKVPTKNKSPYNKVTERFRSSFGSQAIQSAEAKKIVFEKSLAKTQGITRGEFCLEFRDNIFDRMLVNIKFVSECVSLGVDPFEASQFIVMSGNPTVEAVLKDGIKMVFNNDLDILKGEIFSEEELARAKFATLTINPTQDQLSEAKRLISAVSQVLDVMKTAS